MTPLKATITDWTDAYPTNQPANHGTLSKNIDVFKILELPSDWQFPASLQQEVVAPSLFYLRVRNVVE